MQVNLPDVVAEIAEAFERYDQATAGNDAETLETIFWDSEQTVRFGARETLVGKDAIRQFRSIRPAQTATRRTERLEIATFGRDFATVNSLFVRSDRPEQAGRWTLTWVRFPIGWRIVCAHVSLI